MESMHFHGEHFAEERNVLIKRDENGYGLTVCGNNPVFVQSVRDGSAAAKAGVHVGECIIKVNGVTVTSLDHLEVVKLISVAPYTTLTLSGGSSSLSAYSMGDDHYDKRDRCLERRCTENAIRSNSKKKQSEWHLKRKEIIQQILAEEKRQLQVMLERSDAHADVDQRMIEKMNRRIHNLEDQLNEVEKLDFEQVELFYQNLINQEDISLSNSGFRSHSDDLSSSLAMKSSKHCDDVVASSSTDDERLLTKSGNIDEIRDHQIPVPVSDVAPESPLLVHTLSMSNECDSAAVEVTSSNFDEPFSKLSMLKTHLGHLAVFLHYLLSNSDPSYLLFYLLTDIFALYIGKESKKWAYEIHSSFLLPYSPCKVSFTDSSSWESVDAVLNDPNKQQTDAAQWRRLFSTARGLAVQAINEQLADFRSKRILGLGNVFGESMLQRLQAGDSAHERKIFDALITPHLIAFFEEAADFDQLPKRIQVIVSALATLYKHNNVKCRNAAMEKLLERCPTYIAKEKQRFARPLLPKSSRRALQIKAHCFNIAPVLQTTFCYHCQKLIWGIGAISLFCGKCGVVLHKSCVENLSESCFGSMNLRRPLILKKIVGRKNVESSMDNSEQSIEEGKVNTPRTDTSLPLKEDSGEGDGSSEKNLTRNFDKSGVTNAAMSKQSAHIHNLSRSQSMNIEEESYRGARRRSSDTSRRSHSDADKTESITRISTAESSTTVSVQDVSRERSPMISELDSPLTSSVSFSSSLHDIHIELDSDFNVENEIPLLEDLLDLESFQCLDKREKNRLEVIYELFHTEQTHVRNLKILYRLFYKQLLNFNVISFEFASLLFSNLEDVLNLHVEMNEAMKSMMQNNKRIGDISVMMLQFFQDGQERMRNIDSLHCQKLQYAIEALKHRVVKDQKLREFLQVVESLPVCRKLQLKDMLPMEMQRLTKYPLLFENILKYTEDPSEEADRLRNCIECSRSILESVNSAKRNAENLLRLQRLQQMLDTTQFDKVNHPIVSEFCPLDVRRFSLIHEGPLIWRLNKNKIVDLHVVLLDKILLLLSPTSDGHLALRFHNINISYGKDEVKWTHCPLLKLNSLIAKDVATDKKAFFLVSTSPSGPQIYELASQSKAEKQNWFKFIVEQIEASKEHEQKASVRHGQAGQESKSNDSFYEIPNSARKKSLTVRSSRTLKNPNFDERVRITCQPRLISPSEINICQPTVFQHAKPILNPLEKLKQEDKLVIRLLNEKLQIISSFFGQKNDLPPSSAVDSRTSREAREFVISAIKQTNRLLEAINEQTRLIEMENFENGSVKYQVPEVECPSVPCYQLTQIAAGLMTCLTNLLHSLQIMGDDLKRVQRELHQYKLSPERLLPFPEKISQAVGTDIPTDVALEAACKKCLTDAAVQTERASLLQTNNCQAGQRNAAKSAQQSSYTDDQAAEFFSGRSTTVTDALSTGSCYTVASEKPVLRSGKMETDGLYLFDTDTANTSAKVEEQPCSEITIESNCTIGEIKKQIHEEEESLCSSYLLLGGRPLEDDWTLAQCNIQEFSTLDLSYRLLGGAKKRKKKMYTTPKKIKHKKKKVKLAVLKYYKIDENGKVSRLRKECTSESCGAGIFMANHYNRQYCGKCYCTMVVQDPVQREQKPGKGKGH
ncbi:Rho guanine nucleotide exchange factor 12 [Trichinella pseudospiralis]|uniref:Rho guanine nucleotide exchange factor 12 n=1 Tax=Trichinella pseudospiralis TaxID=6337 RepID=A0A0V1JEC1_TRIPS|nr:Rho guanine nucleotide exchange factor 12 [Trichinella pseudospiralis]